MTTRHYLAVAVFWTLGVVGALLMPLPGPETPALFPGADKAVHAVLFGGVGLFWMRATRRPVSGGAPPSLTSRGWRVLAGGAAFAVLTEVAQSLLTASRTADPLDALADLAGLLLAITAYLLRGEPPGDDG